MKQSGYRTIFHIYVIFFLSLLGAVLLAGCLFFLTITVQKPDGRVVRSDWPKRFTEEFKEQIIFVDMVPQIKQSGMSALLDNGIGIQLLDASGCEIFSYQKPQQANTSYSGMDLLQLNQTGRMDGNGLTACISMVTNSENEYIYILYFPVDISKVTMYLNGERFTGGKAMILPILSVLFLLVLISGVLYGFFTTRAMKRLTTAIRDISDRRYIPIQDSGVFSNLYHSLNSLNAEIRASDQLRAQTEKMREEWISNITHDLKTPLSPIKGYAEILGESDVISKGQCRRYAGIIHKNVSYIETLIDDLKLTYQLENGMLPISREKQDIVRFLKELAIDILNTPEYENRTIHFECTENPVFYSFDQTLFTRAFRNLIINAFVHGDETTEIALRVSASDTELKIDVSDNGKGMGEEMTGHLFDRYYRGTNTGKKPEGSGLGLAIAKGIIELHGGMISVASILGVGTTFQIICLTD
ncbi:sensor histidine kinase [Enterocloster aldenensis]|uniref:sensor histidine kinase n=1 Tax=Enterocloster aldenensis TaxID=358742 RepID=UPI000E4DA41C|nr:sensor histidine kinase [Enterocloster aldenensis]